MVKKRMEMVVVDGKEFVCKPDLERDYVKKSKVEKEYVRISEIEKNYVKRVDFEKDYVKKTDVEKPKFEDLVVCLTDEAIVMGMGSCRLSGDWRLVKVSIEYLDRALSAIKSMTCGKKRDSVVIAVANDYPLCLGDVKDGKFSGVVIAPRIEVE